MISSRNPGRIYYGTIAEFMASPSLRKRGDICIPSDSPEVRICNGSDPFEDLTPIPIGQAANVPALGAVDELTAISAEFADLAAAQTAVDTLATETEARLAAIEAKVDAILGAMITAALMAAEEE